MRQIVVASVMLAIGSFALPASADNANPLFARSSLPFQAPPFDKIVAADYQPAIEAGMRQQLHEITAIANNPAPPSFDNTLIALERSGAQLQRATAAFYAVVGANADDALERVEAVEAPKLSTENDSIFQNTKLFARVRRVRDRAASLHLNVESRQLIEFYYLQFIRAGAQLPADQQVRLKHINEQLSTLQAAFHRKLLAASAAGALIAHDAAALAGLSATDMVAASHAAAARKRSGSWLLPLQNTTQQPALGQLSDRATRQQLFDQSWNRTERGDVNDTRSTVAAIAQLRAEKAALLGFPNYAAFVLTDQMAQTPNAVRAFLGGLVPFERRKNGASVAALQAQIAKDGKTFKLAPWDWEYYSAALTKATLDFDTADVRPYLELDNVLRNGVFYAANQLYGVTFRERHDLPVYEPDVRVFSVFDRDGSPLGLIYFDFFKRDNKSGGAWMGEFVTGSRLLGQKSVVYNVENITKASAGQPTLLSPSDVTGMFHEFGHALNGLFSVARYPSLSMPNARDFVEYPSQFNEHWATYPKVLKHYAVNAKTGEAMPSALMAKMLAALKQNDGYSAGELLAADELDLAWHLLPASAPRQDVDVFEKRALAASGTNYTDIPPRYRSSYFNHIWYSGYAAGYYAYTWSAMLDDDTYQWFLAHGGVTRSNGDRFRDLVLSRGSTQPYGQMFRTFYGKAPDVVPLVDDFGLVSK
jgi:peptidyl-dipeptidase Dcp